MNSALGSMKRRISQGQAIRSIFGCSRVTHLVEAAPILRRVGNPCSVQFAMPPSRKFASTPIMRNAAATPLAYVLSMKAVGDDLASAWQISSPLFDIIWRTMKRIRHKYVGAGTMPGLGNISLRAAVSEAFRHRGFWLLGVGYFTCGFQIVFVSTHFPAFLLDQGLSVR